jgi:hypothetical protein
VDPMRATLLRLTFLLGSVKIIYVRLLLTKTTIKTHWVKNMEKSSWILISNLFDVVLESSALDFVSLNKSEVVRYFLNFTTVRRNYKYHCNLAI